MGSKGLNCHHAAAHRPKATPQCLCRICFHPLGYGWGMRGQKTLSQFLNTLFWRRKQTSEGSENYQPLLHAVCHVKALMQCCSHQYYFRPTNSSAFQCMVKVTSKYKRHFLLPITAQLEAAPNLRAACCPTACLQPCRLNYQFPTEVWVLLGTLLFQGAGSDLPLPPTTIHNIPVLVETVSWLRHTKAAALFGSKLLKRSWEQPQTAALQLNQKHGPSLAFLSATSTRKEAFWGSPLRLGWDRVTHWVHDPCSVTQGQNGAWRGF